MSRFYRAVVTIVLLLDGLAIASPLFPRQADDQDLPNPANFTPAGGVDTSPNAPPPKYRALTPFDFQSLNLALNQEYIELDLFHNGLARFSDAEFDEAGIGAEERFLIQHMADQEVSHAQLISHMLGENAAKMCNYTYPFTTVRQFVDFSQKLTRFGESGVYGFLPHLATRPAAQMLLQSITTEARQQLIFRQFAGAFPMPEHFETGLPQAWAWTMLSPYITSCPEENPTISFQLFPSLNITNNPSVIDTTSSGEIVAYESGTVVYYPNVANGTTRDDNGTDDTVTSSIFDTSSMLSSATATESVTATDSASSSAASATQTGGQGSSAIYLAALSSNRTSLSYPGREVQFKWEAPGRRTGYNNKYRTYSTAGAPKFAAWVAQLNTTYTPLFNVDLEARTASTLQPNGTETVFPTVDTDPAFANASNVPGAATNRNYIVNGTIFVALVDEDIYVTPYNLSLINPHVVAGPAIYQAD